MPGIDDELLTVAEIASVLKLNPQTIRNWMDAGTLPYVRVGERRVRVYRSDFEALLRRAQGSSAPIPPKPPERAAPSIWDGVVPSPVVRRR